MALFIVLPPEHSKMFIQKQPGSKIGAIQKQGRGNPKMLRKRPEIQLSAGEIVGPGCRE